MNNAEDEGGRLHMTDADWKPVEGYMAWTLMKLSADLVNLDNAIKEMRFAICHGEPASARRSKACIKDILDGLRAVDYCFEEEREERNTTLTVVKP